jgi:hypothetical protein
MESRRCLGVLVVASVLLVVFLGANDGTINRPGQLIRCPVQNISMELFGRVLDGRLCTSVVVASNAFAKHIRLNFACGTAEVASAPFPVNLVQAVRHQYSTSDDALAFGGFHRNFNFAEEEIEAGPDVRGIETLSKSEVGAIRTVFDHSLVCESPIRRLLRLFGEINGIFLGR